MPSPLRQKKVDAAAALTGMHSTRSAATESDVATNQDTFQSESRDIVPDAGVAAPCAESQQNAPHVSLGWHIWPEYAACRSMASPPALQVASSHGTRESTGHRGAASGERPLCSLTTAVLTRI